MRISEDGHVSEGETPTQAFIDTAESYALRAVDALSRTDGGADLKTARTHAAVSAACCGIVAVRRGQALLAAQQAAIDAIVTPPVVLTGDQADELGVDLPGVPQAGTQWQVPDPGVWSTPDFQRHQHGRQHADPDVDGPDPVLVADAPGRSTEQVTRAAEASNLLADTFAAVGVTGPANVVGVVLDVASAERLADRLSEQPQVLERVVNERNENARREREQRARAEVAESMLRKMLSVHPPMRYVAEVVARLDEDEKAVLARLRGEVTAARQAAGGPRPAHDEDTGVVTDGDRFHPSAAPAEIAVRELGATGRHLVTVIANGCTLEMVYAGDVDVADLTAVHAAERACVGLKLYADGDLIAAASRRVDA